MTETAKNAPKIAKYASFCVQSGTLIHRTNIRYVYWWLWNTYVHLNIVVVFDRPNPYICIFSISFFLKIPCPIFFEILFDIDIIFFMMSIFIFSKILWSILVFSQISLSILISKHLGHSREESAKQRDADRGFVFPRPKKSEEVTKTGKNVWILHPDIYENILIGMNILVGKFEKILLIWKNTLENPEKITLRKTLKNTQKLEKYPGKILHKKRFPELREPEAKSLFQLCFSLNRTPLIVWNIFLQCGSGGCSQWWGSEEWQWSCIGKLEL